MKDIEVLFFFLFFFFLLVVFCWILGFFGFFWEGVGRVFGVFFCRCFLVVFCGFVLFFGSLFSFLFFIVFIFLL